MYRTKEKILKTTREKDEAARRPSKGRPIRVTPDISVETLKARKAWMDVLQTLKRPQMRAQITIPSKTIIIDGERKLYSMIETKFKQYYPQNQL